MLKIVALFDRVSEKYSLPLTVEDNLNLLKRELRSQIVSRQSFELSQNYKDKYICLLGDYDTDSGSVISLDSENPGYFGNILIPFNHSTNDHWLFDLKDLFEESEENKSE